MALKVLTPTPSGARAICRLRWKQQLQVRATFAGLLLLNVCAIFKSLVLLHYSPLLRHPPHFFSKTNTRKRKEVKPGPEPAPTTVAAPTKGGHPPLFRRLWRLRSWRTKKVHTTKAAPKAEAAVGAASRGPDQVRPRPMRPCLRRS